MTGDDADQYTPPQYREHVDGHGERDPDAYRHAGIVRDRELSRFLAVVEQEFSPEDLPPEKRPKDAKG